VDDGQGETSTDEVQILVRDTTPPVITLNGDDPLAIECPGTYNEPGATATDACDPALPPLTISGSVDGNTLGAYTITYSVTDASGNSASKTRTVNVVDTTPPVITLNGSNPMTLECPGTYTEPGAVVTDACDPAPSLTIGGSVDGHTPGTYTVTYTASDLSGNVATAMRTVNLVDTKAPLLISFVNDHLLWPADHKLVNVGLHVKVKDACDSNPALTVTVYSDEDDVDAQASGDQSPDAADLGEGILRLRAERNAKRNGRVYLIVVKATDQSGNTSYFYNTAVVPKAKTVFSIAAVTAQAVLVRLTAKPNGSRYTPYLVGDGPVIGSNQ
jgi:hypothetical protein